MKSKLDHALQHAENGFWVFRLSPNGKTPRAKNWQNEATRDPAKVRELWSGRDRDCNIGAYTSKFMDDRALLVVDVDNKNGKCGDDVMFDLDMNGSPFPSTAENRTPTGGRHVIYWSDKPVGQGANVLGDGLDIRSRGGYIAMAGSIINDKPYTYRIDNVVKAPDWLYAKLLLRTNAASTVKVDTSKIDVDRARKRAVGYMMDAPVPEMGERNDTAFKIACELKDYGCDEGMTEEFLVDWNNDLEEPLEDSELETVIGSAYKTGQNKVGAKAAEAIFEKVDVKEKNPILALNDNYALVAAGGGHHILWETTDDRGAFRLEHLNEPSFHKLLAHRTVQMGQKQSAISKMWLLDPKCRRYDGLVFAPGKEVDNRFYNMWRGFAVEPIRPNEVVPANAQRGLDRFLEHGFLNICNGDEQLFKWVISFFAHMVQYPSIKPHTALAAKGQKGVGKNAFFETFARLVTPHFLIADDSRYLTSNFNGCYESCLFVIFDEASWPGDKASEGRLKGLITGTHHNIEHKGKEVYRVDNLLRMVIMGNDDWIVPATFDERRFCVLTVGNGRKQDHEYFEQMVSDMKGGGDRLLLTYLMNFDLTGFNVNRAPSTTGLIEQKHASLEPFEQWWLDCLTDGRLIGSASVVDFTEIHTDTFRNAFSEYAKRRQIRVRLPDERAIGRVLAQVATSMKKERVRSGGQLYYVYKSNGLAALRKDWDAYVGGKVNWPNNEIIEGEFECLQ